MNGFVEPEYISCGIRKYVIKLFQMLCAEESNMKIMAGFTVVLSIIGLIVSLACKRKKYGLRRHAKIDVAGSVIFQRNFQHFISNYVLTFSDCYDSLYFSVFMASVKTFSIFCPCERQILFKPNNPFYLA